MKIIAYIMLHYGSEYLSSAIKSIDPFVEKINILYSAKATHQVAPDEAICPDSKEFLKRIAKEASNKVNWINVTGVTTEGAHLAKAFEYTNGADLMLRMDSDEVWDQNSLQNCIDKAANIESRQIGIVGFVTLWRSFNHCVNDGFGPIRIHNLKSKSNKPVMIGGTIYHFGYAIHEEMMKYKLKIHGHRDEFPTAWIDRWLSWRPGIKGQNWHPVTDAYWHIIENFDKNLLPEFMKSHPYYDVKIIR